MLDYYEVLEIEPASSSVVARYQHLKNWKDVITQESSISFYTSAVENQHDFEFKLSMFKEKLQEPNPKAPSEVELIFRVERKHSGVMTRRSTIDSSVASSRKHSQMSTPDITND